MGNLTRPDATLFRNWFKEMAFLRGITVQYQYLRDYNASIHGEIEPTDLSDPVEMHVIFDTNPKISTLHHLGWSSESNTDKPYVMQVPWDTPHLTTHCRVSMNPDMSIPDAEPRMFEITRIESLMEFPDCFTCLVVPVYKTSPIRNDYSTGNYNYLDTDYGDVPDADR